MVTFSRSETCLFVVATSALSTVGTCVSKDFRMARGFWCHFTITSARWRCSPQECHPKGLQSGRSCRRGAVASSQVGNSLGRKPRKSTSFYFLLICSVFNVAGTEPFAFPIPGGLGRHRLLVLPSSLLFCLTAGEFRLVLCSAFRLFQVYCSMDV